jgi:N-methylhydantoinase B
MVLQASLDPVTFEVIWHRLLSITEEMGTKYMRTSGSPVLVGAYDAATTITTPDGELVAMGPYITTQAHVIRLLVEATLRMRGEDPGINPDDMWIVNDPYLGATHQPDVATLAPVHYEGQLQAWVGSSGHWLDIGGSEPGGFNMKATSVYDEGLRMPPLRIVRAGEVQGDIVDLVMTNVREPLVELDLRGQLASNEIGRERLRTLFDEYGVENVTSTMREAISYVERRLRARLRELPDGVWREIQYLDHDGHNRNLRAIVCTLTKRSDSLTLDFTGSDPQVTGFANCAFGGLRAAVLSGIGVALGYDLAWNDGLARSVNIIAPPGTVVTAQHPTPVSMSTISAIIVTLNLVLGAASKLLLTSSKHHEEAMATWCGTSVGYSIAGVDARGIFSVFPESSHFGAGCGARTYADGVDTGGIIINTTANTPSVEVTEAEYPILYLFRRQLTDSGGAGRFRGGLSAGVALAPYDARGELETSFAAVGARVPNGYGLGGGLPGSTLKLVRHLGAGKCSEWMSSHGMPENEEDIPGARAVMPPSLSRTVLPNDSAEYHNWQGAGGYGDPLDRDPDLILTDIRAGAVSLKAAEEIYGFVGSAEGVDHEGTIRLRQVIRDERLKRARPAAEVLDEYTGDWDRLASWIRNVEPGGRLRYGGILEFDFDQDQVSCLRCGTPLGRATEDPKSSCVVEDSAAAEAYDFYGGEYADDDVRLLRYYCNKCGVQIDAEVAVRGRERAGFVLAGFPSLR